VVRHVSDRVAVMYLGPLVELARSSDLYVNPRRPYTAALLSAVPKGYGNEAARERIILQGDVPSPVNPPPGCPFHPRCPKARQIGGGGGVPQRCRTAMPPPQAHAPRPQGACWYPPPPRAPPPPAAPARRGPRGPPPPSPPT